MLLLDRVANVPTVLEQAWAFVSETLGLSLKTSWRFKELRCDHPVGEEGAGVCMASYEAITNG